MDKDKMSCELMALQFALTDLNLYLDTHPEDTDAIRLYNNIVAKRKVLEETYQSMYGPLTASHYGNSDSFFDWVCDPWPWQDQEGGQ